MRRIQQRSLPSPSSTGSGTTWPQVDKKSSKDPHDLSEIQAQWTHRQQPSQGSVCGCRREGWRQ
eukprot:191844-Lingulodinium_polyedra.AAC.1